jgi:hypothetical protein
MADIKNTVVVGLRLEDETQKGTQSARSQLKSLRDEMQALEQSGQRNTDRFRQLQTQAGGLADQIGDTQAQIKAMASDTRTLDTLLGVGQGLAGAFAVAQGAAALFGDENEDLQKAMMKVQGALALLNGVQAVANVLNKDSAVMVNLNVVAQRAYALAVGTSTGAMKAFRLALVATGIGAAVVAIGLLIENFDKLTGAVKRFLGIKTESNKAIADGTQAMEREIEILKARGASQEQIFAREFELSRERMRMAKTAEEQDEARHQHNLLRAQYETYVKEQQLKKQEEDQKAHDARMVELRKMREQALKDAEDLVYLERVDGLTQFLEIAETQEQGLHVIKRNGVDAMLKESERQRQREEQIEQAKIETARLGFQTIGNLATLFAGKTEQGQRRAFEVNKKMNMAIALIETFRAAQAAYLSQMTIPDPSAPVRAVIAAAAATAAGLVRVAQISKQQFQSPSGGGGGGGGGSMGGGEGGGGMAAPTATNPNAQLLNPPANGQGQGMRAYVVESDIRSVSGRLRRMSEFATLGA